MAGLAGSNGRKDVELMRQFVAVTKALACEQRLRILMALRERELSEGVISEMLGLTPSTTSRHLWVLRQAGLVDSEKTGLCVCYHLAAAGRSSVAGKTLRWLRECLATHPRIVEDAKQARRLSSNSRVQGECCERRDRRRRWSEIAGRGGRKRRANGPAR